MEWAKVSEVSPDRDAIEWAAAVVTAGGLVIYPTDTLYGIAADPRNAAAIERVFAVKGRPEGQALPLIAASREQAQQVAKLPPAAMSIASRFWPGPLTLVAPAQPGLARGVAAQDGSVAVRVPDHVIARRLAEAVGFAIVSTSANRSGGRPSALPRDAASALADAVDLVLDGGETPGGPPSTIVDARMDPPRLVRDGAVPFSLVLEVLRP